MPKKILTSFLILFAGLASAQTLVSFEVELPNQKQVLDIPVSVSLDNLTFLSDTLLSLVEVDGSKTLPIPFQIKQADQRSLHWIVKPGAQKRVYHLIKLPPGKFSDVSVVNHEGTLTIQSGNKNLLRYYHKTVEAPAGANPDYRRSAFIHPLWTPHGQELTRIQPPDHYHHYGIWNPWTHVLFEKDTVDFWNIAGKKGTVRFAAFPFVVSGPVFAEFKALQEHVVFKKNGVEKVALTEVQTVRVYQPAEDYYIVDITSQLNCANESEVKLLEYRYV